MTRKGYISCVSASYWKCIDQRVKDNEPRGELINEKGQKLELISNFYHTINCFYLKTKINK